MVLNDAPVSGDIYTLGQLLGGDLRIVIPDVQRDYCWGTKGMSEYQRHAKALLFVSGLVHLYLSGKKSPMGLLYGYTNPGDDRYLYIMDGQQRLTTLYLLIGMLYRRTPTDDLRRLLISDYEIIDDQEPSLVYQVRTEAMYFMSDLVMNFFLDRNGRLSQLENSHWYYSVYKSDQSVQSFINALRQIDTVLERAATNPGWDFGDFARYVSSELTFMYHDLGVREQAEKIFITINTTGLPLTAAQSFKALLLYDTDSPQQAVERWEEMEQWAWLHRDTSDPDRPSTSDARIKTFLEIWLAYTGQPDPEALNPKRFDEIYRFFNAYRSLVHCVPEAVERSGMSPEDLFLLLPSIEYIRKWGYDRELNPEKSRCVRYLWDFLLNISRYQKVSLSGSDCKAALSVVARMPEPQIDCLLSVQDLPDRIFNSEERTKLRFLKALESVHDEAYAVMTKALTHPMLNGRIEPVIRWCTDRAGHADLAKFTRYVAAIYEIWPGDISKREDLDLVRRALLTLRLSGYPMMRRGETSFSLCWQTYDWQKLIQAAPEVVKRLLDHVIASNLDPVAAMSQMIKRFKDMSYPYFFLIKHADVIKCSANRLLLRPCPQFLGFYLKDSTNIRWYVEQRVLRTDTEWWSVVHSDGANCLYTEHRLRNLSLYLLSTPEDSSKYRLEWVCSKGKTSKKFFDLKPQILKTGHEICFDNKRRRLYTPLHDAADAVELLNRLFRVVH